MIVTFRALRQHGSRGGRSIPVSASLPTVIHVIVNGESTEVPSGTTVQDLVIQLGLGGRQVAVERNRAVVPRASHAATPLTDGDRLELVTFVGGG